MSQLIGTKKAMQILGVGSTTIERWADEDRLPSVQTAEGNRRFRLTDVVALLQGESREMPGDLLSVDNWVEHLTVGIDTAVVRRSLVELHGRLGDWFQVADFLGKVLEEVGDRWCTGKISIIDEHIASGLLEHALTAVVTSMPTAAGAPVCLFATLTGEQHTLGLSLARLCIKSSAYKCLWAGAETPVTEITGAIGDIRPAAVALSASAWSTDAGSLSSACRKIETACLEHRASLILGGRGLWPQDTGHNWYRCHRFEDLRAVLEEINTAW